MKTLFRLANGYLVTILFIATLFMAGFVMRRAANRMAEASGIEGVMPLDAAVPYDGEKAYRILDSYGEEGRAVYKTIETREDVFYPIVYSLFFFFGTLYFLRKSFPQRPRLALLTAFIIFTFIFDAAENTCIVLLLNHYPERNIPLADFSGHITTLKWFFAALAIGTFLITALICLVKLITGKIKK
jgi:hypothetical protein